MSEEKNRPKSDVKTEIRALTLKKSAEQFDKQCFESRQFQCVNLCQQFVTE